MAIYYYDPKPTNDKLPTKRNTTRTLLLFRLLETKNYKRMN